VNSARTCSVELRERRVKKAVDRRGSFQKFQWKRKFLFQARKKEGREVGRKDGRKGLSGLCFGKHVLRGDKTVNYKPRCIV